MSVLTSLHALRIRLLLVACLAAPAALAAAVGDAIVLLVEGQRKEILPVVRGTAELVPVDVVLAGFPVSTRPDAVAGTLTLSHRGREVVFYARKSLASLGGDLRLLSSPVVVEDGRWLVPLDAVPRLLGPLLGLPAEWRASSRVLVLGSMVEQAIIHARDNQVPKLFFNGLQLTGIRSPLLPERYFIARKFAAAAQGRGQMALAIQQYLIDPEKFGVQGARNAGMNVDVFNNEPDALAWLLLKAD